MIRTKAKHLIILLILICFFAASSPGQKQTPPAGGEPKDFHLPAKQSFIMDNGLAVTMVPYGTLPKVTVRIVVHAGNLNETSDMVWIADLTVDLLKEGTISRNAEEIALEAARMGGSIEVNTGLDQSWVGGDVLSEFGPDLVQLLADIIRNPGFPESEFQRLKKDLIRDLSIAKTRPRNLAREKFRQVLYGDHPYGRSYPTEEMLQSFTLEDVREFYSNNFGAQRTHVYVTGSFDGTAVENTIRKAFEDWQSGFEPLVNIPSPKSQRDVYLVDRPGAPQSTIYLGIPVIDPTHPDYLPMQVTNTILGGYFSSRITTNIREDKGYTYSPTSLVSSRFRDAYWIQLADVSTAVTGATLKEIFYEIDRLQTEAAPEDELKGVQNYMAGSFVLRNSSRSGIIGQLAFMNLHDLEEDYLNTYVDKIHSVTTQIVQRISQDYLKDEEMSIIVVGDINEIRDQVEPYGEIAD
jgi:predicted Zn-dependent peptidase